MPFLSYSYNFEDVMLWRALKHVERGFYIDVGACFPDRGSVTRAFYERGWRGINIEPNPELYAHCAAKRPRDINLNTALGRQSGVGRMVFFDAPGLSTMNRAVAESHARAKLVGTEREVQVTTLARMWDRQVPADQAVHFMNIDVEGFEEEVLRGADWVVNRPWIVLVEAMAPLSQIESHESWESILLDADYLFAYADGLNRFYVAKEQSQLLEAFKYPPNTFDEFLLDSHLVPALKLAKGRAIKTALKWAARSMRSKLVALANPATRRPVR